MNAFMVCLHTKKGTISRASEDRYYILCHEMKPNTEAHLFPAIMGPSFEDPTRSP